MQTTPSPRNANRVLTMVLLFVCAVVNTVLARPRAPMPPLPDSAPVLYHDRFDWAYTPGMTNEAVAVPGYGLFVQSWSGMALERAGVAVAPYLLSGVDAKGKPFFSADTGAVRLWFTPYWTSASQPGGTGPGAQARLLELLAVSGQDQVTVWVLKISSEGNFIELVAQNGAAAVPLLKAEIAWQAKESHQITLNYGPKATALFLDGKLVAEGNGTLAIPQSAAVLALGSSLGGAETVGGAFDEFTTHTRPLTESEAAFAFSSASGQAALGPIPPAEDQFRAGVALLRRAERDAALTFFAERQMESGAMLMSGGCVTNVPVHITNMVCAFNTNDGWVFAFDIVGGTNGLSYDILNTPSLSGTNLTNSTWAWLSRGPTCSSYLFTNQPSPAALFVLGSQDSDQDGLTDAYELLVSRTSPQEFSLPDANGDGIPDWWCVFYGISPTNSIAGQYAPDGQTFHTKFLKRQDPTSVEELQIYIAEPRGSN